jgi:hypothetical protein
MSEGNQLYTWVGLVCAHSTEDIGNIHTVSGTERRKKGQRAGPDRHVVQHS